MLATRMRMSGGKKTGYVGLVDLGTFNHSTKGELARPTRPWRSSVSHNCGEGGDSGNGNITEDSNVGNYSIVDTSTTAANILKWHKFVEAPDAPINAGETIYVCDRNILADVSWSDINNATDDWIGGFTVTIDGNQYTCRLLTGGDRKRDGTSGTSTYDGGYLPNEWDRYVMNNADDSDGTGPFFPNAPIPGDNPPLNDGNHDYEDDSVYDNANAVCGDHNQAWWWNTMYSWCQEIYEFDSGRAVGRGYSSSRSWGSNTVDHCGAPIALRPCLVEV